MTSRYQGLFPPRPQVRERTLGTTLLIIVVGAGSSRSTTNSNNNYLNLCMCSSLHSLSIYSLSISYSYPGPTLLLPSRIQGTRLAPPFSPSKPHSFSSSQSRFHASRAIIITWHSLSSATLESVLSKVFNRLLDFPTKVLCFHLGAKGRTRTPGRDATRCNQV